MVVRMCHKRVNTPCCLLQEFPEAGDDFQDTTADQLAAGKDIQGIPWETTPYTRLLYRVGLVSCRTTPSLAQALVSFLEACRSLSFLMDLEFFFYSYRQSVIWISEVIIIEKMR